MRRRRSSCGRRNTSWVFLAGDLAYKVKKPRAPSLSSTTGPLERRHEMCREEVRLNRRLAPQIYLRVVGIARRRGSLSSLTAEDDPRGDRVRGRDAAGRGGAQPRRADPRRPASSPAHLDAVAGRLARLSRRRAPVAPAELRDSGPGRDAWRRTCATLREAGDGHPGRGAASMPRERFTQASWPPTGRGLEARARGGLVRDCHGDLRAEHVIVPAGGRGLRLRLRRVQPRRCARSTSPRTSPF